MMDVVYDFVESIHIFIPLVAIAFVCGILYCYSKTEAEFHSYTTKEQTTFKAMEKKKEN
ncbi:hypothetical protein KIN20_033794 [Parelaphostrongylus tenuis]|uniref:Uncharacterized protein n=1 Tax=Parelaphostrongylus tenuis TaxID=148309 RepID=A0AAD5R8P2_PARTN|nr:hypothetical protein KIN20_033794 [Parelaphostrongylus tenuis]